MIEDIYLIENRHSLTTLCRKIARRGVRSLAVDLEAENNLHRYGVHLCLVQVFVFGKAFLIDPLAMENMDVLWNILQNRRIEKVMYSAEEDIKILKHSHGIRLEGVYDVQVAAKLLNYPSISLDYLVKTLLKIPFSKNGTLQRSDWFQRPLSEKQIQYAADDIRHLIPLKNAMHPLLKQADLIEDFQTTLYRLEEKEFQIKRDRHMRIGGARSLNRRAQVRLKYLHRARDEIARLLDYPPYWVMGNSVLLNLARRPPRNTAEWEKRGHVSKKGAQYIPMLVSALANAEVENAESR
jgi:ribonuclease D